MLKLTLIVLYFCFCSASFAAINISEYLLNKQFKKDFDLKQYDAAKESISKLLEEDSTNPHYLHNLGQAQLLSQNPEEAEATFQKALSIMPDEDKVHTKLNLAASQLMLQKVDSAIDLYKSVLQKNPSNKIAKYNLELALQLLEQQQEQEQQQQSQEQQQEQQQEGSESNEDNDDSDNQQSDLDNDPDTSEMEQELDDALQKQKEEEEEKKQDAYDILDALSQREKDARKKHAEKQQQQQGNIDYDW